MGCFQPNEFIVINMVVLDFLAVMMESVGSSTADMSQTRLEWLVVKQTLIDNSAEFGRYKKSFLQRLLFLLRLL